MNVTLTSLEALILKATHESLPCPDAAALEAFCTIMRDTMEGPQLAAQALAARIHSQNSREALLALTMLDRCMRRCDSSFHAEVGKFRFLNEMIKLVSPKYFADRTAQEVKTRVLQLFHAWSIEYPKETKFKVAYDMLKNQGVVKETPPPLPPEDPSPIPRARSKNAIFENEEKSKLLQKLLQSKKPEDLQHANRLIKTMVREEERRSEANSKRAQEVSAALDSAGLLQDMLEHASDASQDEDQLIHELHASCMRLRPVLQEMASTELQPDDLDDLLEAHDMLVKVFEKYNAYMSGKKEKTDSTSKEAPIPNSDSLLDFAGVSHDSEAASGQSQAKTNVIDDLGDIFLNEPTTNIVEPLKPVNLMPSEDVDLLGHKSNKVQGWNELDSLGEQLMKQSLPDNAKRLDKFNSKQTKKIPMNSLEKISPRKEQPVQNNGVIFDLDFFTKKTEEPKLSSLQVNKQPSNDDLMVDISTNALLTPQVQNAQTNSHNSLDKILDFESIESKTRNDRTETVENKENNSITERKETKTKSSDVKPLTDINVTLQSMKPSKVPPMTVFEEEGGVTVVLHFCIDKPRPDVNVIVISTTSKNSSPIEDYKFQVVVPKGCKVRLLAASGTSLPAYNPFLPPPALTQVMLIARPPSTPPCNLKYVITYTCDDDFCSEMGEVNQLPLDDI